MSIFENKTPMPPKNNSPDVVRVALTKQDARDDKMKIAFSDNHDADVRNVNRPRRGHGY